MSHAEILPVRSAVLDSAVRKAFWRLVPFACLLYIVNYLDRVNVGFAALTMNRDVGISAIAFGIGAGLFFVGYVAFEVPSNLMMHKFGARRWISRIMITWGVISLLMVLVQGRDSFYAIRLLLGVAEAGFFPGIIFFLTAWFPRAERARIISVFMVGQSASNVVGGPISTTILATMDGTGGVAGWQWLFILEALPAVLLGVACLFVMTDRPDGAHWLTPEEGRALQSVVDEERQRAENLRTYRLGEALADWRIYVLSLVFFLTASGIYGLVFWIPQLVKAFDVPTAMVGFITAIPYLFGAVVSVLWARHSDRSKERIWHVALPAFLSATGFTVASIFLGTPVLAMFGLTLACAGMYSVLPVFWTLPTSFITGRAAAGALALITSLGNMSGIAAPPVIGWVRQVTGGFAVPMLVLAAASLGAGLIAFACRSADRERMVVVTDV